MQFIPNEYQIFSLQLSGIENMTEKESAHPLSPSADVDNPKENNCRDSKILSEESSSFSKTNSIVSVSNDFYSSSFISTL